MFAVIECGGKQYKVTANEVIRVEKLDANVGDKINLNVLLVSDADKTIVGTPIVEGAVVEAEVLNHGKEDKVVVFKYKPKKNVRTKQGHGQPYTELKILTIKK